MYIRIYVYIHIYIYICISGCSLRRQDQLPSAWRLVQGNPSASTLKCFWSAGFLFVSIACNGSGKRGGKLKALLKRLFVLTKPLFLGIGASKNMVFTREHEGTP